MFVVCECMDSVMHARIMVKETVLWVWKLNLQLTLLQQRNKEIILFFVDWFGPQVLPNCSLKTFWHVSGCYCNVQWQRFCVPVLF